VKRRARAIGWRVFVAVMTRLDRKVREAMREDAA
jgi:hypothetical protein